MISVFIPTYNGEKFLAKTLDSLLAQTYRDFEVLCVDDHSKDGTFEVLKLYAEKDSRIKIFQKPNEGDVPHSWQYAIPLINGDFTLYMSQDDFLDQDALEKLNARQLETGADAVLPNVIYYEEGKTNEEVKYYKGVNGDLSPVLNGREAFELMLDYTISGFAIWNTEIIKRVGIRTESYNSDEVAQREWVAHCQKVAFSDARFYYRRDNPNAITRTFATRNLYRPISEARLIELAIQNQLDAETILNHRNEYYRHLWWCAAYTILHQDEIGKQELSQLKSIFSEAYRIIHQGVKLPKWYYKLSVLNENLFWITLYVKLFIAKIRNV